MLGIFKNKKTKKTILTSPFRGEVIDLEKVKDPAFSQKMLGEGAAVIPSDTVAKAPCDGRIIQIFPTNHAFGIQTEDGVEVLVHIGIDTVELNGKGFKRIAQVGERVSRGDDIIQVDFEYLKEQGKDTSTMVIITNSNEMKEVQVFKEDEEKMILVTI